VPTERAAPDPAQARPLATLLGSNLSFADAPTEETAPRSAMEDAEARLAARRARTDGLIELVGPLDELAR
jgi:hypothetical protein